MSSFCRVRGVAAAVAVAALSGAASAGTLTANATDGVRSAQAIFAASGSDLIITLTNTATNDITQPIFVMTALFFDISGPSLGLTRVSAVLGAGSVVINDPQPVGGVVGGEWAFNSGFSGPFGAAYGIGSAGLGFFGPGNLFPGPDLEPPTSPNGLEYGIPPAGDNPATNNGGTNTPLIKNSVVFTLSGLPSGFDPEARIGNITFQYGTDPSEPQIRVPAPGTGVLVAAGLLGLRRRRR